MGSQDERDERGSFLLESELGDRRWPFDEIYVSGAGPLSPSMSRNRSQKKHAS